MGAVRALPSAASVRLTDTVAAFLDTITVANTRGYVIGLDRMVRDFGADLNVRLLDPARAETAPDPAEVDMPEDPHEAELRHNAARLLTGAWVAGQLTAIPPRAWPEDFPRHRLAVAARAQIQGEIDENLDQPGECQGAEGGSR
ncbi:hypothetical protein [Alloactinosynnema sp. L-07]|uniref:hypothetical protein n=1 Tax=Alloactinosynnema sp. L-07 TaxID=1653480 RepID=UPI00065F0281|nr:hypothetical protein [Alloactinosynnema sp. L-07]CRK59204.1 hypothetical protein [Alloactinosynnema sp. L-07]